jgi:hypothetical protein
VRFTPATYALLPQWDWQACYIPSHIYRKPADQVARTISCARIVGDGSKIIEIRDGKLRTWNMNPLELLQEQNIVEFNPPEIALDISRDGGRLCGTHIDGRVEVRDLKRWTTVNLDNASGALEAHFSPDGGRILILGPGAYENDANSGAEIRDYSAEGAPRAYSADGQRVAVASHPDFIAICDALTGEETLRLDATAGAIVFASDGTSLLSNGAPDGGLYFWPGQK